MNPITTVGELRASLTGLADDVPIQKSNVSYVMPPGLYVIRWAAGTYTPESVEIVRSPDNSGITIVYGPASTTAGQP